MKDLWISDTLAEWHAALENYPSVIKQQPGERLPEIDQWYREELPRLVSARSPAHVTHHELAQITEWKMLRGVWRGRNLALVKGNTPDLVEQTSRKAFELAPHPTKPIATLSELAGVGPATASAVLAVLRPDIYPFFDDLVAAQIPGLGEVAYTPGFYARYSDALRERADKLGHDWNPMVAERALWANAGGKAGFYKATEAKKE